MSSNVDWPVPIAEYVAHMEEDTQAGGIADEEYQVDGETDSDHYEDFLVHCEGDTDVEECFPNPNTSGSRICT
jgi:hypothetical protein